MIYQKKREANIMVIDSTFWVAVSFFIFLGILVYFKIPQKVIEILDKMILEMVGRVHL